MYVCVDSANEGCDDEDIRISKRCSRILVCVYMPTRQGRKDARSLNIGDRVWTQGPVRLAGWGNKLTMGGGTVSAGVVGRGDGNESKIGVERPLPRSASPLDFPY